MDDRNLRLAFDRLDTDGKGYITLNDLMELMGASHGSENAEYLNAMWADTVTQADSRRDRITYEDFLLLMKGQPLEAPARSSREESFDKRIGFEPIPECEAVDDRELDVSESGESLRRLYKKMRSRSMDDTSPKRASMSLISHQHRNIENVLTDESKSNLVVQRTMYRAHREMRMAVLEASKRFEEQQAKRQNAELGAFALPMRRESIGDRNTSLVVEKKATSNQQSLLDDASHRGGRSKTSRVKTVSDVSAFF